MNQDQSAAAGQTEILETFSTASIVRRTRWAAFITVFVTAVVALEVFHLPLGTGLSLASIGLLPLLFGLCMTTWTVICRQDGFTVRQEKLGKVKEEFYRWSEVSDTRIDSLEFELDTSSIRYFEVDAASRGTVLGIQAAKLLSAELVNRFNVMTPHLSHIWIQGERAPYSWFRNFGWRRVPRAT